MSELVTDTNVLTQAEFANARFLVAIEESPNVYSQGHALGSGLQTYIAGMGGAGATGVSGLTGISGATGETGPQGPAGTNGTDGSNAMLTHIGNSAAITNLVSHLWRSTGITIPAANLGAANGILKIRLGTRFVDVAAAQLNGLSDGTADGVSTANQRLNVAIPNVPSINTNQFVVFGKTTGRLLLISTSVNHGIGTNSDTISVWAYN